MRKPTRKRQPNVNQESAKTAQKLQPVVRRLNVCVNKFLRLLVRQTTSLQMTHSGLVQKDPNRGWVSELGITVPVTPGSAPCPDGFVVQLSRQQNVVKQPQYADAG